MEVAVIPEPRPTTGENEQGEKVAIPQDAVILTTTRPLLPGTNGVSWKGPGGCGIHKVAMVPSSDKIDIQIDEGAAEQNRKLDAKVALYLPEKQARELTFPFLKIKYPEYYQSYVENVESGQVDISVAIDMFYESFRGMTFTDALVFLDRITSLSNIPESVTFAPEGGEAKAKKSEGNITANDLADFTIRPIIGSMSHDPADSNIPNDWLVFQKRGYETGTGHKSWNGKAGRFVAIDPKAKDARAKLFVIKRKRGYSLVDQYTTEQAKEILRKIQN